MTLWNMRDVKLAVDSNGNIRISGVSNFRFSSRYGTINDAITSLPSTGGIVVVEPGTWQSGNRPISLDSNQGLLGFGTSSIIHNTDTTYTDTHTISATGTGASHLENINISNVKFTGLTGGGSAIDFDYVDDFTIDRIWVDGVYGNCINLTECDYGVIQGSKLMNSVNGAGLYVDSCDYDVISNCFFLNNNTYGIDVASGSTNTLITSGKNHFSGNSSGNVNDDGTDTEWVREGFERSLTAWDETEVTYTDSTGDTWSSNSDEIKSFRVIYSSSHGFPVSDLHICAEMKADAGTGSLGVYVDGGGSPELTLTTTNTSYEVQSGTFSVTWSDETIHTITVKYKNSGAGNTTYNRTFECYAD